MNKRIFPREELDIHSVLSPGQIKSIKSRIITFNGRTISSGYLSPFSITYSKPGYGYYNEFDSVVNKLHFESDTIPNNKKIHVLVNDIIKETFIVDDTDIDKVGLDIELLEGDIVSLLVEGHELLRNFKLILFMDII